MSAEKETGGAVGPTPTELAVGAAIASARYGGSWAWIKANAVETEQFLYEARAAIRAMREPTEAMINCAYDRDMTGGKAACERMWMDMIRAATQGDR